MIVRGRNALRTSGRAIVIFAMPSSRRGRLLVADVRVVALGAVGGRDPGRAHGAKASLCAMVVEGWLAARRARRGPSAPALETPAGSWSYAELLAAARRGAASSPSAGRAAGERVAIALPPGLAFAAGAARLPAARRRRGARSTCARRRGRASAIAGGAALLLDAAAGRSGRRRAARGAGAGRARPRRDGARRPHLRHDRRAAAGRADLRQPALERARLGRRARPRPARSAGCARCRSRTSAGCRSSCARRSTRPPPSCTSASRPTACCTRCASGRSRSSASSRRRSRACSTRACASPPALRCALTGGGPVPAGARASARAARRAGRA